MGSNLDDADRHDNEEQSSPLALVQCQISPSQVAVLRKVPGFESPPSSSSSSLSRLLLVGHHSVAAIDSAASPLLMESTAASSSVEVTTPDLLIALDKSPIDRNHRRNSLSSGSSNDGSDGEDFDDDTTIDQHPPSSSPPPPLPPPPPQQQQTKWKKKALVRPAPPKSSSTRTGSKMALGQCNRKMHQTSIAMFFSPPTAPPISSEKHPPLTKLPLSSAPSPVIPSREWPSRISKSPELDLISIHSPSQSSPLETPAQRPAPIQTISLPKHQPLEISDSVVEVISLTNDDSIEQEEGISPFAKSLIEYRSKLMLQQKQKQEQSPTSSGEDDLLLAQQTPCDLSPSENDDQKISNSTTQPRETNPSTMHTPPAPKTEPTTGPDRTRPGAAEVGRALFDDDLPAVMMITAYQEKDDLQPQAIVAPFDGEPVGSSCYPTDDNNEVTIGSPLPPFSKTVICIEDSQPSPLSPPPPPPSLQVASNDDDDDEESGFCFSQPDEIPLQNEFLSEPMSSSSYSWHTNGMFPVFSLSPLEQQTEAPDLALSKQKRLVSFNIDPVTARFSPPDFGSESLE